MNHAFRSILSSFRFTVFALWISWAGPLQAGIIFSNISDSGGYVFFANDFSPAITRAGSGIQITGPGNWRLDSIRVAFVLQNMTAADQVSVRIRVWDTYQPNSPGSVFSDLLSDQTWNLGSFANGLRRPTIDYSTASQVVSSNDNVIAVDTEYFVNGQSNSTKIRGIAGRFVQPFVGNDLENYYLEGFNSQFEGSLTSDELALGSNNVALALTINATAVPEPSSLACIVLAIVGLTWRRYARRSRHIPCAVR